MNFVSRCLERMESVGSVLCVGLDPTPEHVPPVFGDGLDALENYLKGVIEIASRTVAVVKPQFAYYAAMGTAGIDAMVRLIDYAHSLDLLVILDAKRADISDTMEAYAQEVFGQYHVDACTFVPYLGSTFMPTKTTQSWLPWLAQGRAVISMIRTSNPEAEQVQDLVVGNQLAYERMAVMVRGWNDAVRELTNGEGAVGGVVGATWPEQAVRCRELAGDEVFFLVPGYGAQGGGAEGAVSSLRNSRGELMGTINSSRGITRDSWFNKKTGEPRKGDPMELVARAITAANVDLNKALEGRQLAT